MRRWFMGVVLSVCPVGCGDAEPPVGAGEDVLVLELGGGHARLGDALDEVRARLNAVADGDATEVAMAESAMQLPSATPPPAAEPEPLVVTPAPVRQTRRVRLEKGQTLYRLAVEHLGDGARWRELLTANGWTEADLARLPAGTWVRLP